MKKLARVFQVFLAMAAACSLSLPPVYAEDQPLQGNLTQTAPVQTAPTQATSAQATAEQSVEKKARPRVGLALGGGGTRGAAHIAVIRTLEKAGIPIDCIAGTSMGAIVGGLYCAGMTTDEIDKLFHSKSFVRSYDTVPIPVRVSLVPLFFIPHLFGHHPYDGLYRGNRFATFLSGCIPEQDKNIESMRIPFCAVAANLLDGQPCTIKTGNLGRALQASSAIPGLRRPVDWQGRLMVDGGVVANLPVQQCRDMGADIVIAVNVDEDLKDVQTRCFRKIGSVPIRCLNMHLAAIDAPQMALADVVIRPEVNHIGLLSRKIKDLDLALVAGEEATTKAIPTIHDKIDQKLAKTKGAEGEL